MTDGRGRLVLTFFNQPWRERDLRPGRIGLFAGTVGVYRRHRQLAHPDYVFSPKVLTSRRWQRSSPTSSPCLRRHRQSRFVEDRALRPGWSSTPSVPFPTRFRRRSGGDGADGRGGSTADRAPTSIARGRRAGQTPAPLRGGLRPAGRACPSARVGAALPRCHARRQPAGCSMRSTNGRSSHGGSGPRRRRTPTSPATTRCIAAPGAVGTGKTVWRCAPCSHCRRQRRPGGAAGADGGAGPAALPVAHRTTGPLAERGLLGGSDAGTRVTLLTGSLGAEARREALQAASARRGSSSVHTPCRGPAVRRPRSRGRRAAPLRRRAARRPGVEGSRRHSAHVLVMTATRFHERSR